MELSAVTTTTMALSVIGRNVQISAAEHTHIVNAAATACKHILNAAATLPQAQAKSPLECMLQSIYLINRYSIFNLKA